MNELKSLVRNYLVDESGSTALEYGLIAGLVGLSMVVGASKIASNNDSAWGNMAAKVEAIN